MILTRILRRVWAQQRERLAGGLGVLPPRSVPKADSVPNFFLPVFWSSPDPDRVTAAARIIADSTAGGHHFADNMLTWGRNMSLLDDEAFVTAWRSNIESTSDEAIVWRRYILATSAYHCVQLEGDFVECGAYTGVGMKTVMDYLGGVNFPKTFWGYDAFEHNATMLNHAMPEHGPQLYERVVGKFANYPKVRLMRGLIPEVFAQGCPDKVAYLHIDLNQAPAELASLEQLFDRVVPGGIVIMDDYEWASIYRAQKLAEDPWFDSRRYRVMPLPTGQGLIIKR